jgi:hypothetical protein
VVGRSPERRLTGWVKDLDNKVCEEVCRWEAGDRVIMESLLDAKTFPQLRLLRPYWGNGGRKRKAVGPHVRHARHHWWALWWCKCGTVPWNGLLGKVHPLSETFESFTDGCHVFRVSLIFYHVCR